MKTLQRVLCIMLSVLMAFSCLSVAAVAADDEKFTSTYKLNSTVTNKESAKLVLDKIDELLASLNDGEGIYLDITEILAEETGIKFSEPIVIDLRSVNGLCSTLDLLKRFIEVDSILDAATTAIIRTALGQLGEDVNLKNWTTGMKRTGNDIAILTGILGFAGDNSKVVSGIVKGGYDMGIVNNFVDVDELLGDDGVEGLLKDLIVGILYKEGTTEYNNAYNDIDTFIYTKLIPSFTEEYLPGLSINTTATVDSLLIDIYNICLEKYIKPELSELDVDLSASDVDELKALVEVVNLKGSTYNFSDLAYSHDADFKSQINNVIGKYVENLLPSYKGWVQGDYSKFNSNIENTIKYVANESGIIENAASKTLEEIGIEIALIILNNIDFGAYEAGLEKCTTLEEMATALLINTANEMEIGVSYTGNESYLVVAGDLFAAWAYDNFELKDYNGKDYRPGGGKDIYEVANYFANYFLFDRAGAEALGLSTTKTESIFTKLDKLIDYFGKNHAVDFSTKEFLTGENGLLSCIFTLDIGALLDLTLVPALDSAGSELAVKFIYNTVHYFLKSWAGDQAILPDYQSKAFANALSSASLGNMVEALLSVISSRRSGIVTLATYIAALIMNDASADYTVEATMSSLTATGKALTPKATVKAGNKTLTQDKDYIILSDTATKPGTYTAKIKGIGLYDGEIERSYTVSMGKVTTLSYSGSTTSSVKLSWGEVPYANSYTVSMYDSSKKAYKTVKAGVTGTSYTVTGLSSGKEYKLSVQAVSSAYGTTAAKEITVYTVPSAVTASKITATPTVSSVKLSWTAVSGATHYKVEKYASKKWSTVNTVTATSLTVSGLSGYTSYKFRITALKKLSDGSYLAASPVTVSAKTKLGTPSSLTATSTAKTITLTWSKVTNAEKYQLQQYTGGKWTTLTTTTDTTFKITSKQISKIKTATKYKLAVRAMVKEDGKWVYGERKEITKYTSLATPSSVKVDSSSVTTTTAKLSWKKVTGASSYEVYAYIGGKWTKMGSTKKTAMTVKELPAGKKTKLKVRAVAKLGGETVKSSFSSEVTALTLVSKVSSLKASERKTTSIKMTWKKVTGATSYQVYIYKDGKWKKLATTTKTTYTAKSLTKGTEYKFKVRAVQKVSKKTTRYSAYSTVLQAKTTRFGTARF